MLSALFLINAKGEIIIYRLYRDDVSLSAANAFRLQVIAAKEAGASAPVRAIDGNTFLYVRHKDMFFVAVTRSNSNAAMVFSFLYAVLDIFRGYFEEDFDEDAIRDNFTLVYELLDEILDFGYPQNCALDVLKMYINLGSLRAATSAAADKQMTSTITGARDWRREGIVHKKNEVFIDVDESVNLLVSSNGTVLKNDVSGRIMMKAQLTGMPECKLGLNDKVVLDKDSGKSKAAADPAKKKAVGVDIDDCTFHRCVQLGKFDADRTITFVPPDGQWRVRARGGRVCSAPLPTNLPACTAAAAASSLSARPPARPLRLPAFLRARAGEFELMRYRITDNVNLPFRVIPVIEEQGKTRVVMNVKAIANFSSQLFASNVAISVPVPPNTANCRIAVGIGRAKYEPEKNAVVWRVKRFPGGTEVVLNGEIEMVASTKGKAWVRPPIQVDFQVPMFTASGLHVRSLKIYERSNYQTTKWVRSVTRAGSYQIRT
jgi:AP-2 complex subunit mu-1